LETFDIFIILNLFKGLSFDEIKVKNWLLSLGISFLFSIFMVQPLHVKKLIVQRLLRSLHDNSIGTERLKTGAGQSGLLGVGVANL
jgi:hypothetical protein